MNSDHNTRTSPTLLSRTADWRDNVAWQEFMARYEPLVRSWCVKYHLDGDLAQEVSQVFWIELALKMRSFCYDPSRRFRGWLRVFFRSRTIDVMRQQRREKLPVASLDDPQWAEARSSLFAADEMIEEEDPSAAEALLLLDLGEQVQAAVREKVTPQSWQAFWHIAIDEWSTRETANSLNMSYVAAHVACKRVAVRLAQEGDRRFAEFTSPKTDLR